MTGVYILKFGLNLVKFSFFGPHTHPYTNGGKIWHGGRLLHAKFQKSVQRVAPVGLKT